VRTWQGKGEGRSVAWPVAWPEDLLFSSVQRIGTDLLIRGATADGAATPSLPAWAGQTGTPVRLDGEAWPQAPATAIRTVRVPATAL
jgi:hypothetical protein